MSSRKIATIYALLSILVLVIASTNTQFDLLNPRFFQLESKLLYVIISSVALGALLMFVMVALLPPSLRPRQPSVPQTDDQMGLMRSLETAVQVGDLEKAKQLLADVASSDPSWKDARRIEADLEWQTGNHDQAERLYLDSLQGLAGSQRVQTLFRLTEFYENVGKTDRAQPLYREILRTMPSAMLPLLRLREYAIRAQDWKEALVWQEFLERQHPKTVAQQDEQMVRVGIRYELARVEFDDGSIKTSQALIKFVLRVSDQFVPGFVLAGEIQQRLENASAAFRIWGEGLRNTQNPILLRTAIENYLMQNMPQKAIEFTRDILRAFPENLLLEYCLGDLYKKLEMHQEAIRVFENIRARDPHWLLNRISLTDLYQKTARSAEAIRELRLVLESLEAQPVLPWQCYNCNVTYPEYRSFCLECISWNSISLNQNRAGYDFSDERSTAFRF